MNGCNEEYGAETRSSLCTSFKEEPDALKGRRDPLLWERIGSRALALLQVAVGAAREERPHEIFDSY